MLVLSNTSHCLRRCLGRLIASSFEVNQVCLRWNSSDQSTHFGFQTVTKEEKADKVKEVFSKVADKYDLMNDVMSAGIHRIWKKRFVDKLNPVQGSSLLDVAGGTGDIAFKFIDHIGGKKYSILETIQNDKRDAIKKTPGHIDLNPLHKTSHVKSEVTICDINENMLQVGQVRARELGYADDSNARLTWVVGDAMKLPFEDNSFDCYTIAFGIRNVVDVDKALEEAHRVLKPGGVFSCLEFSKVQNPVLESLYDWYSFQVIPVQGEVFAGDWKSYQYLVESIRKFPEQDDFAHMMNEAGFGLVDYENLTGGVAAIHTGYKKD